MHILVKHVKFLIIITLYFSPHVSLGQFQQNVDYQIEVSLNHIDKTLAGDITILYDNQSKDTLKEMYFHLWPNAYDDKYSAFGKQLLENNNTKFLKANPSEHGSISGLSFTIDGVQTRYSSYNNWIDVIKITLHKPLLPGQKIEIKSPFKVKFPAVFSRMGYDGNYFIATQWYPKPAVYDEQGWHPMPYLEQGEYYADFASFDVSITLSNDYYVGATGVLQNANEKARVQARIEKFKEIPADSLSKIPFKTQLDSETKTLNFKQDNVTDFAWFASPDFWILKDTAMLNSGKSVDILSYFLTPSLGWKNSPQKVKQAVELFSDIIGEYPYSHCSLVEGPISAGGGMEYPMITIVDNFSDAPTLEVVIAHEIAHNWWQGILAPNERRSPWIDEGFTSHYEKRYMEQFEVPYVGNLEYLGKTKKLFSYFGFENLSSRDDETTAVLLQQRKNRQQPINTSSEELSDFNYYAMVYAQSSLMIEYLESYLGRTAFDSIMSAFYLKYQFKHIDAQEIQDFFEATTVKDLNWFFKDIISGGGKTDFAIKGVQKSADGYLLRIKNKTEIAQPIPIEAYEKDSLLGVTWQEGFIEKNQTLKLAFPTATRFELDGRNLLLDYNRSNNIIKTSGLKKIEPLSIKLLGGLERFNKSSIAFTPIISGNKYDKWMVGMLFSNSFFPSKQFQWSVMPIYAIGSKQFNWQSKISYSQHIKNSKLRTIEYELFSKSFSYNQTANENLRFYKWYPKFTFNFKKNERASILHQFSVRHNQVYTETIVSNKVDDVIISKKQTERFCANILEYTLTKRDAKFTNEFKSTFQFNKDFGKLFIENNFFLPYAKRNNGKGFSIRAFAGTFLYRNDKEIRTRGNTVNFNTTNVTGRNDYLFDGSYMYRNGRDGFLSQQVMAGDGSLKGISYVINDIGKAGTILVAANLRADFPFRAFPISTFFDFVYHNEKKLMPLSNGINYAFGAMLRLLDGGIEVYVPFVSSADFKNHYKVNRPKFGQKITFAIDLEKLDIRKKAEKYYLGF